jgi:Tol biopolymer transport system component
VPSTFSASLLYALGREIAEICNIDIRKWQRLRAYSERLQAGLTTTRERYGWLAFLWSWYGKVILKTVPWVLAIAAGLRLLGLAQGPTGTASTQTVAAPVGLGAKGATATVAVTSVVTAGLVVALTPAPAYRNTLVSVAFGRIGVDSTREVYVLRADGDDLRRLTDDDAWDSGPDLFDDERIVFSSDRKDDRRQLWTMGVDGSAPKRLTRSDGADFGPDWSPDGERIVFVRGHDGDSALYVIDADGSDERRLSGEGRSYDVTPDWSPDGDMVVFARGVDGAYQIHVVDADGGGLRRLGAAEGNDVNPRWSPDGEQIVFSSDRDGNEEVYVMAADGSDVERLTTDPAHDRRPSWSPDGDKILFSSGRGLDEGEEVWAMDPDGSDLERLTDFNEQGW